jgi:hypothetical protein
MGYLFFLLCTHFQTFYRLSYRGLQSRNYFFFGSFVDRLSTHNEADRFEFNYFLTPSWYKSDQMAMGSRHTIVACNFIGFMDTGCWTIIFAIVIIGVAVKRSILCAVIAATLCSVFILSFPLHIGSGYIICFEVTDPYNKDRKLS